MSNEKTIGVNLCVPVSLRLRCEYDEENAQFEILGVDISPFQSIGPHNLFEHISHEDYEYIVTLLEKED